MNRREFMQHSGALALGSMLSGNMLTDILADKSKQAGLQLFTLFNVLDDDVKGNLQKVAGLGYKKVESAFSKKGGYYGMKPKEFKALLSDLGLQWASHHVSGAPFKPRPGFDMSKMPKMLTLKSDTNQVIDEVAEGGVKYLVCASIPIENIDEIKAAIDILSKAGEAAKKAGITLCYHNHDKEFQKVESQTAYEMFLSQISADSMKMELDLAWANKAGIDPVELFVKHPKRFPMWHVKDFDKDFKTLQPVGQGVIDFKRIFMHAKDAGLKHFFVEHDMPTDPFQSISASIKYLKTI